MLSVRPTELARLPWELLYDREQKQYLCLDMPLIRRLVVDAVLEILTRAKEEGAGFTMPAELDWLPVRLRSRGGQRSALDRAMTGTPGISSLG